MVDDRASAPLRESRMLTGVSRSEPRVLRFAATPRDPLWDERAHAFAHHHALSVYRANAVYSFIPKNGCSTLRYSIALHNGSIAGEAELGWIHKNNATFRASLQDLLLADYTFVVLRCPYRRIVSVFLDKIIGQADNRLGPLLAPRWRRSFVPMQHYRDAITFRRFLELLARPGALMRDHHWAPQSRFLVYRTYDDYFRVEAFAEAGNRLAERIGLKLKDARELTGHGTDALRKITARGCADFPAHELRSMRDDGCVPDYADFFDAEAIAMVRGLYGEDLELYGRKFGPEALRF